LIRVKQLQTRRRERLRKPRNARRIHAKTRLTHRTAPVDWASTIFDDCRGLIGLAATWHATNLVAHIRTICVLGDPAGSAPLEGKSPSDRMRPQGKDNYQKHRGYRPRRSAWTNLWWERHRGKAMPCDFLTRPYARMRRRPILISKVRLHRFCSDS
jgi:hypothetical protein